MLGSKIKIRWAAHKRWPGKLIVFCGGDGSGKSTQIAQLRAKLERTGKAVLVTKQPTNWYRSDHFVKSFLRNGGPRSHARAVVLFSAADRIRHCYEVVAPALRQGKIVLCDRYIYSALVYFGIRGLPRDFIAYINSDIIRPDIAIYLRVSVSELVRRLKDRNSLEHHAQPPQVRKVLRGYEQLAGHFVVIDGERSVNVVEKAVWSALAHLLSQKR